MRSKFGPIRPWIAKVVVLEHLKQFSYSFNGTNVVNALAPLFLIGFSSFFQVTRVTIKAWMSSKFSAIPPPTVELAALECLEKKS